MIVCLKKIGDLIPAQRQTYYFMYCFEISQEQLSKLFALFLYTYTMYYSFGIITTILWTPKTLLLFFCLSTTK